MEPNDIVFVHYTEQEVVPIEHRGCLNCVLRDDFEIEGLKCDPLGDICSGGFYVYAKHIQEWT